MKAASIRVLGALVVMSSLMPARVWASGKVDGVYSVPVSAELEKFASYEVKDTVIDNEAAPSRLRFGLPLALTGVENKIELFRQTDGTWKGNNGDSVCSRTNNTLSCKTKFKDLVIDAKAVEAVNASLFAKEFAGRMAVARAFSTEPVGILSYDLNDYRPNDHKNENQVNYNP
jgi:hypothetical protein